MTARPPKPWDDLGSWLGGAITRRPALWCGVALVVPGALIATGPMGLALAGLLGAFAGLVSRRGVGPRAVVTAAAVTVALAAIAPDRHLSEAPVVLAMLALSFAIARGAGTIPRAAGYLVAAGALWALYDAYREPVVLGCGLAPFVLLPACARWEREVRRFLLMGMVLVLAGSVLLRPRPDQILLLLGIGSILTAFVDLLWFAGRALMEPDVGERGEAARVRVLVRMQRRPWVAATSVVFVALGLHWWFELRGLHELLHGDVGWLAFLHYAGTRLGWVLLIGAGALLHEARGRHRESFERLAAWIVPVLAALLLDVPMALAFGSYDVPRAFLHGCLYAALPLLWAYASGGVVDRLSAGAVQVLALVGPAVAIHFTFEIDDAIPSQVVWALLAPVVLHALARYRGRVLLAVLAGTVLGSLFVRAGAVPFLIGGNLCLVAVATAFVAAMRQAGSLTAVPLDHPIVADYARNPAVGTGRVIGG